MHPLSLSLDFIGRATSTWGSLVSPGYLRTEMITEFFLWMKRLQGFLTPLYAAQHHKPRKQRPCSVAVKVASDGADTTATGSCSTAFQGGLAGGLDALGGGAWSHSMKVTTECDSSDSEHELRVQKAEAKEREKAERNPMKRLFMWSGFSHDCDVVRLGRVGRLRNCWSRLRRRRLGFEIVRQPKRGKPSGRPIAPEYSSSEDSCVAFVDDQKKYRVKPRVSRKLISKQRARVVEYRQAMRAAAGKPKRDRECEVLSNLYGQQLGPFEPAFQMSTIDWPGSPLETYERKLADERNRQTSDEVDGSFEFSTLQSPIEECWVNLSQNKRRVRGIECKADRFANSQVPLGFVGRATDLSGAEHQLIGVDNNEFWRRMGDNKTMNRNLHGLEDLLAGW